MRTFAALLATVALQAQAWAQTPNAEPELLATAPITAEAIAPSPPLARPPPARLRPDMSTDEGGLWGVTDRAEQSARASGQLERDPALNTYIHDMACRVAAEYCGDIRLYVMNRPFFNASMAPNGYMEVWSGLMLRAEDEAELAFVLGHETAHYTERHSLGQLRATRARATGAFVATIGIAVVGAAAAVNSPTNAGSIADVTRVAVDAVYLGTIASLFGFSREQESEADALGFNHAVAAGYDARAGVTIWEYLIAETQASDNPDVRRRETRNSVFSTHPLSADRVAALRAMADQHGAGGVRQRDRYRAAIRPHLNDWLRAELRRRDFGPTLLLLERLGAHGEDLGVVEYFLGETLRLRRATGDLAAAKTHYFNAIAQADAPAAAWRELGDAHARDGERTEAAAALRTYLERAPQAEDKALVEQRLAQLEQGGNP